MPKEIKTLASTILTNPKQVVVTPVSSTAEKIEQELYHVVTAKKKDFLLHILGEKTINFVLIFTNRSIIDTMPENWNTANRLIASIAAVHCLFITFGKSFYQLTWVTMAGMVALLTMQHVVATNFRTNG